MKIITKRPNGTIRVCTENKEPDKTDQSFAKMVNVNEIVAKFKKTGQITHLAKNAGKYADVSNITDLHESLIKVQEAQNTFLTLPAYIRKQFNNNPQEMIAFLQDPKNDEQAVQMGLKTLNPNYKSPQDLMSTKPKKPTKKAQTNDDDSNDDENA
ncbi:MAG: internal scaffolding protein [Arizlama microvirus]|nr:MAG: internal scaffolding protein [Arizlama microvirus]